ncbi:hypothetical protein [Enterococcus sp. N249-2]
MSIKNTIYKIKNPSGYDSYHFESNNGQVQVLDASNNVLGTMKEFAQEGKVVTSGKVTDLKVTGLYKIKNVTGLPTEVDVSKISILSITSVGATNSPEMINYELITENGSVYKKTVIPGKSSTEWSSGGTKLENSINTIISNFGSLSTLKTTSKSSLVNAINEVDTNSKLVRTDFNSHIKEYNIFKLHNHDETYIKKSGDKITGNITFSVGTGIDAQNADGKSINLLKQTSGGEIEVGSQNTPLNIYGSNIFHNGKKIWTEANDGKGSGLDADKFQGNDVTAFATIGSRNDFKGDVAVREGKSVVFQSDLVRQGIFWRSEKGETLASIKHEGNGAIGVYNGSNMSFKFDTNGVLKSTTRLEFDTSSMEGRVAFKLKASDTGGMGFYRNANSKYLGVYNWDKGERLAYFDEDQGFMYLDKSPSITGRKLFLQSGQPSGTIPEGSIWIS